MKQLLLLVVACAVLAAATFGFQAQNRPPQPAADPYVNNAAPGATQFPLAAPAGKDSNAKNVAPSGAVNQGPFDPSTWKYGTAFNPPAGATIDTNGVITWAPSEALVWLSATPPAPRNAG